MKYNKVQRQLTPKTHMIGFVIIAGAVLLGTTSALLNVANQVSAQITPSASSVNELGFMAQNTTDPVQNTTAANITQLATVLPTVNQPIAPTSFAPVSEESDESTSSSNNDDDDDSNSDNNGEDDSGGGGGDSGDDDSGDDDSGDGNGGGRSASAGGAFASAG